MNELLAFIDKLASTDSLELTDEKKKELSDELKGIYSSKFLYFYSILSSALEEKLPDEREQIEYNLRQLFSYFDEDDDCAVKFHKLYDHISLESIRLNRMSAVEYYSENAFTQRMEAEKLYSEMEKNANRLNRRINNSYSQIVSILGIFTGIVLSCVFAMQLFQSSLSNLTDTNFYKILLFCLIISFAIFNLVFMLLYVIGKLSGISLAVNYNIGVSKHRNAFNMLISKYPYVFYFDVAISLLAIVVYIFKCRN